MQNLQWLLSVHYSTTMHGVFSFWEDQCDLIHNVVFYMWRKYCYMNLIGCTLFPELIKFRVTCRIHVVIGVIDMAVIDVFGVINISVIDALWVMVLFGVVDVITAINVIEVDRRYWGNELYFSGVMNFISVGK